MIHDVTTVHSYSLYRYKRIVWYSMEGNMKHWLNSIGLVINTYWYGFNMSENLFFTRACIDSTFHRGKGNHVEWNHTWDEMKKKRTDARKIFWAERRGEEQRGASQREKGKMMDWTWEDNEEWNTVQQNVISQTVVWGALLPFHWDCYYRWISPTKTSIPRVQHFLDFAVIEAGFENPALKAGECHPQWGCVGIEMKVE